MSNPIRYTQKFYKWYDEDIWGHLSVATKNSRVLKYLYTSFNHNFKKRRLVRKKKFFIKKRKFRTFYKGFFLYRINIKEVEFIRKKRNFKAKNFFNLIKLRSFYGRIKVKPFKYLLQNKFKNKNLAASVTPLFLEGRLDILLYRTNLFNSIFALKSFIRKGYVFVNGYPITEVKTAISVGDIITISPEVYDSIFDRFLKNLKANRILTNFPKYIEVNYRIGSFILVKKPKFTEISYPFGVPAQSILHQFVK